MAKQTVGRAARPRKLLVSAKGSRGGTGGGITLAIAYRVVTVDGVEAAERLLNSLEPGTDLVQSHIETVRDQPSGEQENTLLDVPVTRFLFIFRTV
jgi:hypothetical protein